MYIKSATVHSRFNVAIGYYFQFIFKCMCIGVKRMEVIDGIG